MLHDRPFTKPEAEVRSLANLHGHRYPIRDDGSIGDDCPDPDAHARDVEDMTRVLQMLGFAPYESMPRPDAPRGVAKLTTSYMPPGRR